MTESSETSLRSLFDFNHSLSDLLAFWVQRDVWQDAKFGDSYSPNGNSSLTSDGNLIRVCGLRGASPCVIIIQTGGMDR